MNAERNSEAHGQEIIHLREKAKNYLRAAALLGTIGISASIGGFVSNEISSTSLDFDEEIMAAGAVATVASLLLLRLASHSQTISDMMENTENAFKKIDSP